MLRDVLIVDDHPSIVEGLRSILTGEFSLPTLSSAGTAEEAIALASSRSWSLIITDLSVPGRSGTELVAEMARLCPNARILVHTVHSERQFGVRAMRAGAHGYITKDKPMDALLEAIGKLMQGRRFISEELAEDLVEALQHGDTAAEELLSDREYQVLKLLASGLGITEIANQLHVSAKTVSTYRSRMLEKLRLGSTAELIRYAIENNLTE